MILVTATFTETVNSISSETTFAEYTFTFPNIIRSGDPVMIEYGGPASAYKNGMPTKLTVRIQDLQGHDLIYRRS